MFSLASWVFCFRAVRYRIVSSNASTIGEVYRELSPKINSLELTIHIDDKEYRAKQYLCNT